MDSSICEGYVSKQCATEQYDPCDISRAGKANASRCQARCETPCRRQPAEADCVSVVASLLANIFSEPRREKPFSRLAKPSLPQAGQHSQLVATAKKKDGRRGPHRRAAARGRRDARDVRARARTKTEPGGRGPGLREQLPHLDGSSWNIVLEALRRGKGRRGVRVLPPRSSNL